MRLSPIQLEIVFYIVRGYPPVVKLSRGCYQGNRIKMKDGE